VKFTFFNRSTSLLAQTSYCLTFVFIRHDKAILVSSTTLVIYTSLIRSTARSPEGPFSSPEKGLRQCASQADTTGLLHYPYIT